MCLIGLEDPRSHSQMEQSSPVIGRSGQRKPIEDSGERREADATNDGGNIPAEASVRPSGLIATV